MKQSRRESNENVTRNPMKKRKHVHVIPLEKKNESVVPKTDVGVPSLNHIGLESFSVILSYLGPCSKDLVSVSQVSKHYNTVMRHVGDGMMEKARSNFRLFLKPVSLNESSISCFVRHARECEWANFGILLIKNFLMNAENTTKFSLEEMNKTLDLCLYVLKRKCSRSLEIKGNIISGRCASRIYKTLARNHNLSYDTYPHEKSFLLRKARSIMMIVVLRKVEIMKSQKNNNIETEESVRRGLEVATSLAADLQQMHKVM